MTTTNDGSLPDGWKALVDEELERQRLRTMLFDGASSPPGPLADDAYFVSLRGRLRSAD